MISNEQAKQEAIKKAYGGWYDTLKKFINDNGSIYFDRIPNEYKNIFGNVFWNNSNGFRSPTTLNGIETNNGWTRIEPDGSNLPTSQEEYYIIMEKSNYCEKAFFDLNKGRFYFNYRDSSGEDSRQYYEFVTHYMIIKTPIKPIY